MGENNAASRTTRMKDILHDEVMAECFRSDPDYAQELLAEVHRDGSQAELAILQRKINMAFEAASPMQPTETG